MGGSSSKSAKEPKKESKKEKNTPPPTSANKEKTTSKGEKAKHSSTAETPAPKSKRNEHKHEDFEKRLRHFYEHYKPELLVNVPSILEEWKGSEKDLFKELVARYGPEPPMNLSTSDLPISAAPIVSNENVINSAVNPWEGRFARHMVAYTPNRLDGLEKLLRSSAGKERRVMRMLVRQTGPEPEGPLPCGTCEDSLDNEKEKDHEKKQKIEKEDEKNEKKEDVNESVVAPSEKSHAVEDSVVVDNNNNPEVDVSPTAKEETNTSREPKSVEKEDVLPPRPPLEGPCSVPVSTEPSQHSLRRRLSAFLGVRAPQKHHQLEECLRRYCNEEEELFQFLCGTYGPEPTEEEATAYFVQRLETFYEQHDTARVKDSFADIQSHYGKEEEFLQSLETEVRSFNPTCPRRSFKLFEYDETFEVADEGILPADEQKANRNRDTAVEDPLTDNAEALETSSEIPKTVNTVTEIGKENTPSDAAEVYRRLAEDQQQQLNKLQTEIENLRAALVEESARAQSNSRGRSQSSHADSFFRSNSRKASSPVRTDAVDDFLPPPPFFRAPRQPSPPRSTVKKPFSFVSKRSFSSSSRRVRTLAEMRAEYERERDAIRRAEDQLMDPFHSLL